MKNAHITVDVGAAEKYYKVIWNNPDEFTDVIIHLRVVHAFMHFFSNCGKYVINSGFKEIVCQARLCSVGGTNPVLSGKSVALNFGVDKKKRKDELKQVRIQVLCLSVELGSEVGG